MPAETSAALLDRARRGSTAALDDLFARHGRRLLALVRLRLGRSLRAHLESGDIVQGTLVRALRGVRDFAGHDERAFAAWLVRIAESEIADQAKRLGRARRDVGRDVPLEAAGELPEERIRSVTSRLVADERVRRLDEALAALPEEQREVVRLRRFEELSWAEIGERLERSSDACRMLFARATSALALAVAGEETGKTP